MLENVPQFGFRNELLLKSLRNHQISVFSFANILYLALSRYASTFLRYSPISHQSILILITQWTGAKIYIFHLFYGLKIPNPPTLPSPQPVVLSPFPGRSLALVGKTSVAMMAQHSHRKITEIYIIFVRKLDDMKQNSKVKDKTKMKLK